MTRILILINYLLLIKSTIQAVVPLYGQCGGIGYTGSTDCGSLGQCVVINSYYYQCLPITSAPSPNLVPLYGQCGGIGYTGPTQCDIQGYCVFSNPYYSQCLPVTNAPATTNSKPSSILTTLKQTSIAAPSKSTSGISTLTTAKSQTTTAKSPTTTAKSPTTTAKSPTTTAKSPTTTKLITTSTNSNGSTSKNYLRLFVVDLKLK